MSSALYYRELVGVGTSGIRRYYAGEDHEPERAPPPATAPQPSVGPAIEVPPEAEEARRPIVVAVSYRKLLEVTHFHLFTMPVVLLIVGHLFLATGLSERAKRAWLIAGVVSVSLHLATPWLVRAAAGLAPLHALSGIGADGDVMSVLTLYPVAVMWRRPAGDGRSPRWPRTAMPRARAPPADRRARSRSRLTLFRQLCYKGAHDIENGFHNQFGSGRPGLRSGSGPRAGPGAPPATAPAPGAPPVAAAGRGRRSPAPPPAAPAPVLVRRRPMRRPSRQGPAIELPSERDMPQMTLPPRETAIENPLRQEASAASARPPSAATGELTLNAPAIGPSVIDLRRLVLFVGHNFNERIRFYSELEVEHAVASSTDQGEFEVEQAYLDGLFSRHFNLRAGLIIMPVGIINVYHEPPTFNGVDRPDVDTLVIPSTWREAGFGAFGEITQGLSYQVYLTSGFDANGFTAEGGIQDGHQEAQLASASTFGAVARLTYEPMLATIFGLSAYGGTSGSTRATSPGAASLHDTVGNVPLGLFEADARTRYRGFTARAEIAFLFIGDTGALNTVFTAGPQEQMDAVAVASCSFAAATWEVELQRPAALLAPGTMQDVTAFFRYDYANTQASVAAGFTANPALIRYTETVGLVYRPIPEQVGIKADYRRYEFGAGPSYNEFATALTWMF